MSRLVALLTNTVFLWILLGAVVILGLVGTCHRSASSAIPPKTQRALDSLKATAEAHERTIDSLKTSSAAATTHATTSVTKARTIVVESGVNRRLADSLATLAAAQDSAELAALQWRQAYSARTLEADSLRVAVALLDSAQAERERARVTISAALAMSEDRRKRSEEVNAQLERAIANAEKGCRVLWVAKCPTRIASFAVGNVTGAAIVLTLGALAGGR